MARLTEAQSLALKALSEGGVKSGGFYADLGIRQNTLHSLEREGLLESYGHWRPRMRQWRITEAGRRALENRDG